MKPNVSRRRVVLHVWFVLVTAVALVSNGRNVERSDRPRWGLQPRVWLGSAILEVPPYYEGQENALKNMKVSLLRTISSPHPATHRPRGPPVVPPNHPLVTGNEPDDQVGDVDEDLSNPGRSFIEQSEDNFNDPRSYSELCNFKLGDRYIFVNGTRIDPVRLLAPERRQWFLDYKAKVEALEDLVFQKRREEIARGEGHPSKDPNIVDASWPEVEKLQKTIADMQLLWELERSGWNDTNKEFNFETMLTEKYREGMIDDIMDSIVPKGDQEDENNPFAGHSSPTLPPSPSPLDEWARKDGDGNTETQEAVQAAAEVKKRLQIGDEKGVREMLSQLNLDTLEKLSGEDHDPGVREMSKEDEARDKRAAQHIDRIEQRRVAQPDDLAWWEIDPRSGPPGGPSVGEWNETRVKQWAVEENMPMHLRQSLEENFINGNILLKYTDRMMEKDGLKRGQRAMLLQYIKLLKAKERARWGPKSIELEPYLWIDFEPEHEDHPAPEWNHVVAPSTQRAQAAPVEDESEKDLESIYGDDNSDS